MAIVTSRLYEHIYRSTNACLADVKMML